MNAKQRKAQKLAEVKMRLAEKYSRRANTVGSRPLRKTLLNRMEDYRRQSANLKAQAKAAQ